MNLEPALTRLTDHAKALFRPDWQHEPFTIPLGLQPVTIATDGKALLACVGDCGRPAPSGAPAQLHKVFEERDDWFTVDLAQFREWLGTEPPAAPCAECKGTKEIVCPECKGAKRVPHGCNCDSCDLKEPCDGCNATGKIDCDCEDPAASEHIEFGEVFGIAVDRRLLRRALPDTPGTATLAVGRICVTFVTDEWALVVMGLSYGEEGAPRFGHPPGGYR